MLEVPSRGRMLDVLDAEPPCLSASSQPPPRPSAVLALAAVGLGFGCDRGGAAFTPLDGPPPDAPVDAPADAPEVVGTDYSFVVSRLRVPGSVNEATLFGLDIDDLTGTP